MEAGLVKIRYKPVKEDFDGPWKVYFRDNLRYFLQFADPVVYDEIDWSRDPEFLDKELRRISRGINKNNVVVDCLVKVRLKSGGEHWILVHIEFQAQKDTSFPERMFVYNTRAFNLYRVPIASYVLLADENLNWKPDSFGYGFGQSSNFMRFGVLKLTDFIGREVELETNDNPFALAILAHLKTLETKGNPEARYQWKLRLAKMLFLRGWDRKAVDSLFGFIDWVMRLPQLLEDRFDENIVEEEEVNKMELLSPREKRWRKVFKAEGRTEGRTEESQFFVLDTLNLRFGSIPENLEAKVRKIESVEKLRYLHRTAIKATALSEFEEDPLLVSTEE